jgi:hypothetical protein
MPGTRLGSSGDVSPVPATEKTSAKSQSPKQAAVKPISPAVNTDSEPSPSTTSPASPQTLELNHQEQLKATCGLRFLSAQAQYASVCKDWKKKISESNLQLGNFTLSVDPCDTTTSIPGHRPAGKVAWEVSNVLVSAMAGAILKLPIHQRGQTHDTLYTKHSIHNQERTVHLARRSSTCLEFFSVPWTNMAT